MRVPLWNAPLRVVPLRDLLKGRKAPGSQQTAARAKHCCKLTATCAWQRWAGLALGARRAERRQGGGFGSRAAVRQSAGARVDNSERSLRCVLASFVWTRPSVSPSIPCLPISIPGHAERARSLACLKEDKAKECRWHVSGAAHVLRIVQLVAVTHKCHNTCVTARRLTRVACTRQMIQKS